MDVAMIYLIDLQLFCSLCMTSELFQMHDQCLDSICEFYLASDAIREIPGQL